MASNMPKQNKGAKAKKMSNPHAVGGKPLEPRTGTPAVEFRGTMVHAKQMGGITRPAHGTHGSHDSKIREHADHED
jgi:hypothetical protein